MHRSLAVVVAAVLLLAGCATPEHSAPERPAPTPPVVDGCPAVWAPIENVEFDQELHDELVAMLERDSAGRQGTGPDEEGDEARTERLRQILAEHGWPSFELVGEDGEDAAWAIAQHSDLDPAFQRCAFEHLRVAVEAGQGSPGNLAYLEDRIHAGAGEPQRYGTQIGCTPDGPVPGTPLIEPERIEELRASVGLPPYADYLAEMTQICAEAG